MRGASVRTFYIELRHRPRMLPFAGRPHALPGVVRAQIVDQVPTRLARQRAGETGHREAARPARRSRA